MQCLRGGEGGCWAGGPRGPHARRPSCPSSVVVVGAGVPGLSCQQVQLQLSLPRPPQSSPLSTNPQGRHGPPTLQMRKTHFRNWPTVPANTGDKRRRRRGPAPRPGPPQGTQGRAWAQLSSRHCLSTRGRVRCQLCLREAWSARVAVLTRLRTVQQTSTQKGQSQGRPWTGPLPSERLLAGKGSPASPVTTGRCAWMSRAQTSEQKRLG